MRILVVSDSHGHFFRFKEVVEKHRDAELIFFLGDGRRELEDICDHIGLLHKGGILFDREIDAMKTSIHKVQMVLPGEEPDLGSFRSPN